MMNDVYKLSREGSIQREVQDALIRKYGQPGKYFRKRDIAKEYIKYWERKKKRKFTHRSPTLGVQTIVERSDFIVHHKSSDVTYWDGGYYHRPGIWYSIVSRTQLLNCRDMGLEYGSPEAQTMLHGMDTPQCEVCQFRHPAPVRLEPMGRAVK